MRSVRKCSPELFRAAHTVQFSHVGWPVGKEISGVLDYPRDMETFTYGTISSRSPLRKRMGTSVMFGKIDSLGQI